MTNILRFRKKQEPTKWFQVSKFKQLALNQSFSDNVEKEQHTISGFINSLSQELVDKNKETKLHPLTLTMNPPEAFTLFSQRKNNPYFHSLYEQIIKKYHFSCYHCGFQCEHSMEIVNKNNDPFDNDFYNLIPVCSFCVQCHFFDSIYQDGFIGGSLIYLPEMPQHILNNYCHVLFSVIENSITQYYATAIKVRGLLRYRAKCIETYFGKNYSNLEYFSDLMIKAKLHDNEINDVLKDIRILPAMNSNIITKYVSKKDNSFIV